MKKRTIFTVAISATLFLASCAHKITSTASQNATMSQAAVDTLKKLRDLRLPIIQASDKMILKIRSQFAIMEKGQLVENMKELQPTIKDTLINGVKVYIITPKTLKPENRDKIAYYIHGGGYVMGSATDQTGLIMAHELGLKTYSIEYTLAPEAKFPVAMNQCLSVYKYLVSTYDPQKIIGYSTSSGSANMMAMLLKAKQENLPMINSIALLSPSLDLSGDGDSYVANDGRDILGLKNQSDKLYAKPFTGAKDRSDPMLKDPLVSPIYGTYSSDFPATVITTSTRDLFLSNSSRMYWKLKAAGVPAQLDVAEGMWHAFTVYKTMPEAVEARKSAIDFMFQHLNAKSPKTSKDNRTSANIEVVKTFVAEVINKGNIDKVDELWARDMKWHFGETTLDGIDAYKKSLKASIGGAFKDMHLDILNIVADNNNNVTLYFTNSGLNVGSFNGMPATNKYAKWHGMGIYHLNNGKITEAWFSEDILDMYKQLGFVNTPKK